MAKTFSQIVIALTTKGFITEGEDNARIRHIQNSKGEYLTDYIRSLGFSFIHHDYRGINNDMWSHYQHHQAATGIRTNGKTWSFDNTLHNHARDINQTMDAQALQDYKKSNWNAQV